MDVSRAKNVTRGRHAVHVKLSRGDRNAQGRHAALLSTSGEHKYHVVVHAMIFYRETLISSSLSSAPKDERRKGDDQRHVQDQNSPGLPVLDANRVLHEPGVDGTRAQVGP